jgi:uncharacterized spore protein YtfJ
LKISIGEVKTDASVGEAIKIGDRTIYPVNQVSTLNRNGTGFFGVWISPLAIVVVEPTQKYAISLTSETITLDKLLEKAPSLKEKLRRS